MTDIVTFLKEIVLPAFVGGGTALVVAGFLSKKLIDQKLTKELEVYKNQLTSKTESLKSSLSIYAHEQNIVSSRIDTQTANAIHEVYGAIRKVIHPALMIVSGSPIMNAGPREDLEYYEIHAEESHKYSRELSQILSYSAIYIDEETYAFASELASKASYAVATFLRPIREGKSRQKTVGELLESIEIERKKLKEEFESNISPLEKLILCVFREQLGTVREQPNKAFNPDAKKDSRPLT